MNTLNKSGRPKKTEWEKRKKKIQISLTQKEWEYISKNAQKANQKQLATYLRTVLLSCVSTGGITYKVQSKQSIQYMKLFINAFNNLNQSTKQINTAYLNNTLSRRDLLIHANIINKLEKRTANIQEQAQHFEEYAAIFEEGEHDYDT
ncbi:hypothetical protein CWN94_21710 [Vibrio splendidus]|uniref:hypothetical protein n=1 Tax=Vibrio splendidus TaxID=29497 RepID=UPI000D364AE6|nr:hypothetical protein [Vibrio splendidus]PTO51380.1 hypothetical protein CWN94_21710 [Vibrio splendidus]